MNDFFQKMKEKTHFKDKIFSSKIHKTEHELQRVESYNLEPDSNDCLNEEDIIMFDSN